MSDEKTTQVVIQPPEAPASVFQQQAFGPWTTNDPQVQRVGVKTNAQSGSIQKKFQSTYPPAPTISETRTATSNGFEFSINVVNDKKVAGYNVYSSLTNNAAIAKLIQFQSQPPATSQLQTLKIQDTTAASPFYWVASVNQAGNESVRMPMKGNPAPRTTGILPSGGGSGTGSGGGAVSRKGGPLYS